MARTVDCSGKTLIREHEFESESLMTFLPPILSNREIETEESFGRKNQTGSGGTGEIGRLTGMEGGRDQRCVSRDLAAGRSCSREDLQR